MISAPALTYALASIAAYSPPGYCPKPFEQGRHLTQRERLLYREITATDALGLKRTPRHWQTLAHLVITRPRFTDAPCAMPPEAVVFCNSSFVIRHSPPAA